MFNEILIAKAEHQLRNAQLARTQDMEGVTVTVPNVIDRALQALHDVFMGRQYKAHTATCCAPLAQDGAAAR